MIPSLLRPIGIGECTILDPPAWSGLLNGAYTVKHTGTGRIYVGSTKSLYTRTMSHRTMLRGNKHPLSEFQRLYNLDPRLEWEFCIVESRDEAMCVEQQVLDAYWHTGILLNLSPDARVSFKGLSHSEDTRTKMSASAMNRGGNKTTGPGHVHQNVEINGVVYRTYQEAADAHGVSYSTVRYRTDESRASFPGWKRIP